jgi:hypothetical protein
MPQTSSFRCVLSRFASQQLVAAQAFSVPPSLRVQLRILAVSTPFLTIQSALRSPSSTLPSGTSQVSPRTPSITQLSAALQPPLSYSSTASSAHISTTSALFHASLTPLQSPYATDSLTYCATQFFRLTPHFVTLAPDNASLD